MWLHTSFAYCAYLICVTFFIGKASFVQPGQQRRLTEQNNVSHALDMPPGTNAQGPCCGAKICMKLDKKCWDHWQDDCPNSWQYDRMQPCCGNRWCSDNPTCDAAPVTCNYVIDNNLDNECPLVEPTSPCSSGFNFNKNITDTTGAWVEYFQTGLDILSITPFSGTALDVVSLAFGMDLFGVFGQPSVEDIYALVMEQLRNAMDQMEKCMEVKIVETDIKDVLDSIVSIENDLDPYLIRGKTPEDRVSFLWSNNADICGRIATRMSHVTGVNVDQILPLAVRGMEACATSYLATKSDLEKMNQSYVVVEQQYQTMAINLEKSIANAITWLEEYYMEESRCGFYQRDIELTREKINHLQERVWQPVTTLVNGLAYYGCTGIAQMNFISGQHTVLDSLELDTIFQCAKLCAETDACRCYSFTTSDRICSLQTGACNDLNPIDENDLEVISGFCPPCTIIGGQSLPGTAVRIEHATSVIECRRACLDMISCECYTFFTETNACFSRGTRCSNWTPTENAISGLCYAPCSKEIGVDLENSSSTVINGISSLDDCRIACKHSNLCECYTFNVNHRTCHAFERCEDVTKVAHSDAISGSCVETSSPSVSPTTLSPSISPSAQPSLSPTRQPSISPTTMPSISPSVAPSTSPVTEAHNSQTNSDSGQIRTLSSSEFIIGVTIVSAIIFLLCLTLSVRYFRRGYGVNAQTYSQADEFASTQNINFTNTVAEQT